MEGFTPPARDPILLDRMNAALDAEHPAQHVEHALRSLTTSTASSWSVLSRVFLFTVDIIVMAWSDGKLRYDDPRIPRPALIVLTRLNSQCLNSVLEFSIAGAIGGNLVLEA